MRAGIYARISVLHRDEKDQTIENQILLAKQFITQIQREAEITCYIDRGFSGQNFRRPSFLRMVHAAQDGELDLIVAKDLSRFGRNYLETGWYLEQVLPAAGVRVVALGEQYDSDNPHCSSLHFGLRNILNEWYAKETGEKVRQIKQRQKEEGQFLGSRPPYGYRIIDQEGRRVLQPDDSYPILRRIKRLHREGMQSEEIANRLTLERVCRPEQYRQCGQVICPGSESYRPWDGACVRRLWN